MDVYNAGPQAKSKARNLRKTLARVLTASVDKSGKSKK
jgi:ribosomal protein L29